LTLDEPATFDMCGDVMICQQFTITTATTIRTTSTQANGVKQQYAKEAATIAPTEASASSSTSASPLADEH